MNSCYRCRQEEDQQARSMACEDGDGDSDGEFGTDQETSFSSSLSTLRNSKDRSPVFSSSSPPLCDEDHDDTTPRTSLPFTQSMVPRKDRWGGNRCRGCSMPFLLVVAAVILLTTTLITIKNTTSYYNIALFRGSDSDGHNPSSLSIAQRFLQNKTDIDTDVDGSGSNTGSEVILDDGNITSNENKTLAPLATIDVTLPAGVSIADEGVADVIDSLITISPSMLIPRITSPEPSNSHAPTYSPSTSLQPSHTPTISPRPSISVSPTTLAPSLHPSFFPNSPSELPSFIPTNKPTTSLSPTPAPTISFEPSTSHSPTMQPSQQPTTSEPSQSPTVATLTIKKVDNYIMLRNVPSLLHNDTIDKWQNVTSEHIINYYGILSNITSEPSFRITHVSTTFKSQFILKGKEIAVEDHVATTRQDQPIDPPPIKSIEIPGTLTVEIYYDQKVTYESEKVSMTDDELSHRLFVIPFTTDSFHYSLDLYTSLNWTTWVDVLTVAPGSSESLQPIVDPESRIASKLTSAQTFAISVCTIVGACFIVLFLLWERNHKGDNRRGEESASIGSTTHRMQRNPSWDPMYYTNDGTADDSAYSSVRSAPTHLRKNSIERGIVGSKDNGPVPHRGIYGTEKSGYSKESSSSSNTENNQEVSSRPPLVEERVGSPGIPQHVPVLIPSIGLPSTTNRNNNNRPFLPLLPPLPSPSSFGTPERARTGNSLESGPLNEYNTRPTSTSFRRPSTRPSFGMRVSSLIRDDMTDISVLTDPFPSDRRRFNEGFVIPNPQITDTNLATNRSRFEKFTSPLHMPDEDTINRAAVDPLTPTPESPVPAMPTILGLDDGLTPTRAGFGMTVKDIEDDLEK